MAWKYGLESQPAVCFFCHTLVEDPKDRYDVEGVGRKLSLHSKCYRRLRGFGDGVFVTVYRAACAEPEIQGAV